MEEEKNTQQEQSEVQESTGYQPRPLWQRIAAGIGLVLFVLLLIMFYVNIMRGGL